MKIVPCSSCGATFADTETKCPYCGNTHVPGAKTAYQSRMRTLRERIFAHTERAALYRAITLRAVLCVLLAVLLAYLAVRLSTADMRRVRNMLAEADANAAAYASDIDAYLASADFNRAREYMDWRAIHISSATDPLVRYAVIRELLDCYSRLFRDIAAYAFQGKPGDNEIDFFAELLQEFYDLCSDAYMTSHPYAAQIDTEATAVCAERMQQDLEVLMRQYLFFSKEDIAALPDLSKREIMDLLNARSGREEGQ